MNDSVKKFYRFQVLLQTLHECRGASFYVHPFYKDNVKEVSHMIDNLSPSEREVFENKLKLLKTD